MLSYKKTQVPWREIDGRTVILHPQNGQAHELNLVASFLWKLLDGKNTETDLIEQLTQSYEISRTIAASDVCEFLDSMKVLGLIQEQQ